MGIIILVKKVVPTTGNIIRILLNSVVVIKVAVYSNIIGVNIKHLNLFLGIEILTVTVTIDKIIVGVQIKISLIRIFPFSIL